MNIVEFSRDYFASLDVDQLEDFLSQKQAEHQSKLKSLQDYAFPDGKVCLFVMNEETLIIFPEFCRLTTVHTSAILCTCGYCVRVASGFLHDSALKVCVLAFRFLFFILKLQPKVYQSGGQYEEMDATEVEISNMGGQRAHAPGTGFHNTGTQDDSEDEILALQAQFDRKTNA